MTSVFSWQNSINLCPVSFHIPRPNLPVTPGVSCLENPMDGGAWEAAVTICSDVGAQENKVCPPKNNGGALNHNFDHVDNITGEGNENAL